MSEEEQKAIEFLKTFIKTEIDYCKLEKTDVTDILNVIKQQQKEIEEKSTIIMAGAEKVKQLEEEIEDLKTITQNYNAIGGETFGDNRIIVCSMKYFDDGYFKKNYIFKDKIREKIKELESLSKNITMQPSIYNYEIDLLEELLKEN